MINFHLGGTDTLIIGKLASRSWSIYILFDKVSCIKKQIKNLIIPSVLQIMTELVLKPKIAEGKKQINNKLKGRKNQVILT